MLPKIKPFYRSNPSGPRPAWEAFSSFDMCMIERISREVVGKCLRWVAPVIRWKRCYDLAFVKMLCDADRNTPNLSDGTSTPSKKRRYTSQCIQYIRLIREASLRVDGDMVSEFRVRPRLYFLYAKQVIRVVLIFSHGKGHIFHSPASVSFEDGLFLVEKQSSAGEVSLLICLRGRGTRSALHNVIGEGTLTHPRVDYLESSTGSVVRRHPATHTVLLIVIYGCPSLGLCSTPESP
jgi:hypothetical protein